MDNSARLSLPYLLPSQAQKHVTHNTALERLDLLVQLVVEEFDATTPPTLPQEGQIWALGAGAASAWAGQDDMLAAWMGEAWLFVTPSEGWIATDAASGTLRVRGATGWGPLTLSDFSNLAGVGIGTGHDATNRLAVSAQATLLTHDGAGHQLKVNKAAAGDTASLLFQTGWSGRAEMGTAGTDDFAIKVSPDGSTFHTGAVFDRNSGAAAFPNGASVAGQDVYHRANILGSVSLSGGVPTGAVIEQGSNANGNYVRFADGTQICQTRVTAGYISGSYCAANWSFPSAFANTPSVQITISGNTWTATVVSGLHRGNTTPIQGNLTLTAMSAQVWARSGTSFGAADVVDLNVMAIGPWT